MTDVDKQSEVNLNHPEQSSHVNLEKTAEQANKMWTGSINLAQASTEENFSEIVFNQLCKAFNKSPFFFHCGMTMRVVDGEIKGFVDMNPNLIGNVAFQILHGGVAATLLDSIGGIVAMGEIYCHGKGELKDRIRQVAHLATTDMRVDYLSPGRGTQFIATAEALRMGRKGCTMRMNLHNQEQRLIATATAAYVY
jgi:uncharacterized protein (TIGR00369 family)